MNASLRVGQMTCLEYAAMMGFEEILSILIEHSQHAKQLHAYFALGGKLNQSTRPFIDVDAVTTSHYIGFDIAYSNFAGENANVKSHLTNPYTE